ncbi:hypothetical protein, variant 1 [Aphanomyces invadans]|uniref:Uncharacterized protein n=1 Tax=Aphanomyces invadans TaxID=157072 RepID=A0A024UG13_9STRA|nr:hypothetical protein, variant 1 [Aphanomyces invadans]ETW04817.1 hypothetical protein, variant 1 [Aphanomyces invadans]|eukprot:XP_008866254.1 hypothetical protein, variant 1 [Aphanomyces invadans]
MASQLVPNLYRALLRAAKEFHSYEVEHKCLYAAVRSGSLMPYDGIREDWKQEQSLRSLVDGMTPHETLAWVDLVAAIRSKFRATDVKLPVNERIDRAFSTLRLLGLHNDMVHCHNSKDLFTPKRRDALPMEVLFKVGDIVRVEGVGRGVVCSWHVPRLKYRKCTPKYTILPHIRPNPDSKSAADADDFGDRWRLYHVDETRVTLSRKASPVKNPSLLCYFDGFEGGRHVPCRSLAARYPDDDIDAPKKPAHIPSILDLQNAEEPDLVLYLQSADATVAHIARTVLEAKWMDDAGPTARRDLEAAMEVYATGNKAEGQRRMKAVIKMHPGYVSAVEMLAIAALDNGNAEQSLELFQRVVELKPFHLRGLSGLATSAAKLKRWDVAHASAAKLFRLDPTSSIAKRVLAKVDDAIYYLL